MDSLKKYSVRELYSLARANNIPNYNKLTKNQLITILNNKRKVVDRKVVEHMVERKVEPEVEYEESAKESDGDDEYVKYIEKEEKERKRKKEIAMELVLKELEK